MGPELEPSQYPAEQFASGKAFWAAQSILPSRLFQETCYAPVGMQAHLCGGGQQTSCNCVCETVISVHEVLCGSSRSSEVAMLVETEAFRI